MDDKADHSVNVETESAPAANIVSADAELIQRVRAGDETAYEELFHRHKRRVSLIASRFFRQREQIEEIVQETFTKAYFALTDFSSESENSFPAWLARIAFNTCYDELRRKKRRGESAMSDISEEEEARLKAQLRADHVTTDVESALIARDLAGKLLSRLSVEDRMVLVMLDVEGLSVNEIAEMNRWSISKVKVRAHRARASLRRVMERLL